MAQRNDRCNHHHDVYHLDKYLVLALQRNDFRANGIPQMNYGEVQNILYQSL